MPALFAFERGAGGIPIVFLHGFGLSHAAWAPVLERIDSGRHLIAFDLPGHAGSLGVPHGSAAVAAKAVVSNLAARGIVKTHVVGHSMGGATAALVALRDPKRVAALTLLSPGGFGETIAADTLRRNAAVVGEDEIAALLQSFFSKEHPPPAGLAAWIAKERRVPGATQALTAIVETFFDGDAQKVLPLADLKRLAIPTRIVWGAEDRILPASQAEALRKDFPVAVLPGVGHMLPYEAPEEIARIVDENI